MKRSATFLLLLTAMTLLTTSYSRGPFYGGTGNRTGSAGSSAGCDGPICHAANGGAASLSIALLQNGVPVTSYIPNQFYRVRLTLPVAISNRRNFGFQASIVRAADGVAQAGILTDGGRSDISVHQDVLVQLVEHNRYLPAAFVAGNYLDTVSFGWQAPAAGMGTVRVYAVMNAVDSSRSPSGDQPRSGFQDFAEAPNVGISQPTGMEAVAVFPNPTAGGMLQLRGLRGSEAVLLAVVDMRGAVVMRTAGHAGPDGSYALRTGGLAPGQYVLVAVQKRISSIPFQVK